MSKKPRASLDSVYQTLFSVFGPQHWWPGETPFEIMVGAILTQNTNWGNVEKAIVNLKKTRVLTPQALQDLSVPKLARLIKPSGFFNIKARRLKNFLDFFFQEYQGRVSLMKKKSLEVLRPQILSVSGIGPETADSILLYALDKPVFVIDAYTKRIFSRHFLMKTNADYHTLQKEFMSHLPKSSRLYNEYHALIVKVGKDFCKPRPNCASCPLGKYRHKI